MLLSVVSLDNIYSKSQSGGIQKSLVLLLPDAKDAETVRLSFLL